MSWPLKARIAIEEAPLGGPEGLSARVLVAGCSWALTSSGGDWQVAMPIAVVDRRLEPKRVHPVVDVPVLLAVAAMAWLVVRLRPRRA